MAQGDLVDLELGASAGSEAPAPLSAPLPACGAVAFAQAKAQVVTEFERRYVLELLAQTHGNLSLAARLAGKERSRFGKLVKKYGLQRSAVGDGDPPHD
jgi:DNA-binding NtrC family response regulator